MLRAFTSQDKTEDIPSEDICTQNTANNVAEVRYIIDVRQCTRNKQVSLTSDR